VQLRLPTALTFDEYVKREGWREASLSLCPVHETPDCGFARHGTYVRKVPGVARVTRYYCPDAETTFGLLPDFYASRFPGTLQDIEDVVVVVEQAASVEAAANEVRPDDVENAVTLPSALRWVRRRLVMVREVLVSVLALWPAMFAGCTPTVASFRKGLGTDSALVALRVTCEPKLHVMPVPVGLVPRSWCRRRARRRLEQSMGPAP
jgi:hypothetical protein